MGVSRESRVIGIGLAITVSLLCALGAQAAPVVASQNGDSIHSAQVWIALSCGQGCLWKYGAVGGGPAYSFAPPVFEVDGKQVVAKAFHFAEVGKPIHLDNGVTEYAFEGLLAGDSHLSLRIEFQVNGDTPVVRFRYTLKADKPRAMTAPAGENRLTYFETSLRQFPEVKEISLSNFVELSHSYTLGEQEIAARNFEESSNFMGPILAASDGRHSFLVAYEHGSEVPFTFLHYQLNPDHEIGLTAVKGNYLPGQTIDVAHSYSTVWLETAAVAGDMDQLASNYRRFVLKSMAVNTATRAPYIYYNTYGHQERNKWWNGNWWSGHPYPMNQENILKEIDVAHRMGVDVFVRSEERRVGKECLE